MYKEIERLLKSFKSEISPEKAIEIAKTIYQIQSTTVDNQTIKHILLLTNEQKELASLFNFEFGWPSVEVRSETVHYNLDGFLFPNPAQNKISIRLNVAINKIEILDPKGQLILEQKVNLIDISNLQSGIYFVKVITENGKLFSSKFIKN